jgi:hypothetical protein
MKRSKKSKKPPGKKSAQTGPRTPNLVLTGERRNRRFRVDVGGRPAWLSAQVFEALCLLAHARHTESDGFVELDPNVVFRMRRAIAKVTGLRAAKELIVTGSTTEYALSAPASEIVWHHSFAKLPVPGAMPDALKAAILRWPSGPWPEPKPDV